MWDGDPDCPHDFLSQDRWLHRGSTKSDVQNHSSVTDEKIESQFCSLCGAWKGELGPEPSFHDFIRHLVQIFSEAKRVLRDDGCLFVNIGDTFASSGSLESRFYHGKNQGKHQLGDGDGLLSKEYSGRGRTNEVQAKSLCLIPERFAIAMLDAGWILRNKIVWNKINCLPNSVKDRFTSSWEYVYFFTKSKQYFFKQQFEPIKLESVMRSRRGQKKGKWHDKEAPLGFYQSLHKEREFVGYDGIDKEYENSQGRNMRDVFSIPTKALHLKHYAAFPEALVEPLISSGCPEFVCTMCGKPRKKIYEYSDGSIGKGWTDHKNDDTQGRLQSISGLDKVLDRHNNTYQRKEVGYSDCKCGAPFEPGVVCDIFMGAGTTAVVAKKLNRHWLGIELNNVYIKMAEERIKNTHVQTEFRFGGE